MYFALKKKTLNLDLKFENILDDYFKQSWNLIMVVNMVLSLLYVTYSDETIWKLCILEFPVLYFCVWNLKYSLTTIKYFIKL